MHSKNTLQVNHLVKNVLIVNKHEKYRGTSSLTTGNLIGKRVQSEMDTSDIGRWSWQRFRGRGEASICIIYFYRPFPPAAGGGPGSV